LRKSIFFDNLNIINRHNAEFFRVNFSFQLGINKFADLTFAEYTEIYTFNQSMKAHQPKLKEETIKPTKVIFQADSDEDLDELPSAFDWRDRGAVTPVKDQLKCGSCYAMSAIGAIESHHFIRTGQLVSLSEQEIIDCAGEEYNLNQCFGGVEFKVFEYIRDRGGISAQSDYPYTGKFGECRRADKPVNISVKGYGFVQSENSETFKRALVSEGPLTIGVDQTQESFMRYAGGIYFEPNCEENYLTHAVLLVGFGVEDGEEFWVIKNSFGVTWGENGYMRIAMNRGNDCGVKKAAEFPIVEKNSS
jgi:cathepsin L